jgi:hypothetical protein
MLVKYRLLFLVISATLLMAGCSNNADSTSTQWPSVDEPATNTTTDTARPALPRACTLVTAEEAQAVVGYAVGQMADDPENCMWAGGDNPGRLTMLMVQIIRADTAAESNALFDSLTGLSGNLNMTVNDQLGEKTRKSGQEIEGLGDAAWCSSSNADLVGTQQMIVRNGTIILSLNVTGMTKGERKASLCPQLEIASRKAFSRLGGAQ